MPQKLNSSALAAENLCHDLPRHSDEKITFEPTKGQTPLLSLHDQPLWSLGEKTAWQQLLSSGSFCFANYSPALQD